MIKFQEVQPETLDLMTGKLFSPSGMEIIPKMKQSTQAVAEPDFGIPLEDFHSQLDEVSDLPIKQIKGLVDKHPQIKDKKTAWQRALEFLGGLQTNLEKIPGVKEFGEGLRSEKTAASKGGASFPYAAGNFLANSPEGLPIGIGAGVTKKTLNSLKNLDEVKDGAFNALKMIIKENGSKTRYPVNAVEDATQALQKLTAKGATQEDLRNALEVARLHGGKKIGKQIDELNKGLKIKNKLPDTARIKFAYHGSPNHDISELKPHEGFGGLYDIGVYMTEDKGYAKTYAGDKGKIYSKDLSGLNILEGNSKTYKSIERPFIDDFINVFEENANLNDFRNRSEYNDAFDNFMADNDNYSALRYQIQKKAKSLGYDGVYYKDGIPEIVLDKKLKIAD